MNPGYGTLERSLAVELGRHIYRARVALGVKQEFLAESVGLKARGSVSNWERGKRLIPEKQWNQLKTKAELQLPDYHEIRAVVARRVSEPGDTSSVTAAARAAQHQRRE